MKQNLKLAGAGTARLHARLMTCALLHVSPRVQADDVSQTLCCLAIPADMSVAHFCTFIGAYLGEVRSMQVCAGWGGG